MTAYIFISSKVWEMFTWRRQQNRFRNHKGKILEGEQVAWAVTLPGLFLAYMIRSRAAALGFRF